MRIDGTDGRETDDLRLFAHTAEAASLVDNSDAGDRLALILAAMDEGYSLCEMICDAAGRAVDYRFLEVNAAFERITGLSDVVGRRIRDVIPGIEVDWIETYARVAFGGETLRFESRAVAFDRVFSVSALPIPPRGRFVVLFRDVTDRVRAEAALGENEALLRAFFDNSTSYAFAKDLEGRYIFANRFYLDAFDIEDFETLRGKTDRERFGAAEPYSANDLRVIAEGVAIAFEESAVVADGGRRYAISTKFPLRDRAGRIFGVGSISTDITDRKEAEEQRKLLLAELNHRVKNTLALVQGVARQTFKPGRDPAAAVTTFNGRLRALAASHDILTRESWTKADLGGLVGDVLDACGVDRTRVTAAGPAVELTPKQAINLTLALHELCTNALKYGALSVDAGRLTIAWNRAEPDGRLSLSWREQGGPRVVRPKGTGFGLRMIQNVLRTDFDADLLFDFAPEGFSCRVVPRGANETGEAAS